MVADKLYRLIESIVCFLCDVTIKNFAIGYAIDVYLTDADLIDRQRTRKMEFSVLMVYIF